MLSILFQTETVQLHLDHKHLRNTCRREAAARQAVIWELACRKALEWSMRWPRYTPPHVRARRPSNHHHMLVFILFHSLTHLLFTSTQMIELGEDVLYIISAKMPFVIKELASTCRCLRGLLLPRLLELKARAFMRASMSL